MKTNDIKFDNLTLGVSFYAFGIAYSSIWKWNLALLTMVGVVSLFEPDNNEKSALPLHNQIWLYVVLGILLISIIERYVRHVLRCEDFLKF